MPGLMSRASLVVKSKLSKMLDRAENPFLRYWLGTEPALDEHVRVAGEEATLLVWSPDYDGKGKALVRLAGGEERIVGGSRVERN